MVVQRVVDLKDEDLKSFGQWESKTPGHLQRLLRNGLEAKFVGLRPAELLLGDSLCKLTEKITGEKEIVFSFFPLHMETRSGSVGGGGVAGMPTGSRKMLCSRIIFD